MRTEVNSTTMGSRDLFMLQDKCMSLTKKFAAFGSGGIRGVSGKKKLYHAHRNGSRRKVKETL